MERARRIVDLPGPHTVLRGLTTESIEISLTGFASLRIPRDRAAIRAQDGFGHRSWGRFGSHCVVHGLKITSSDTCTHEQARGLT